VSIPTTAAEAAAILRDLARGREDGDGADVWPLYDRAEDAMAAVVALDLAATRLESERAAERARAAAAEAECARLTTERDAARRDATFAETERDTLRALTDSMREDNVRLRAIIEGRATAPTEAELVAHIAAGGRWLVSSPGEPDVPLWSMPVASVEHGLRVAQDHHDLNAPWRWHALLDGRPCPWPTPALDAAREGR